MTTAIDTNIFVELWDEPAGRPSQVRTALDAALQQGGLIVSAPVYSELLGFPSRTEAYLDQFFKETGTVVDWNLGESVWRTAGLAFQGYSARRRRQRESGPRRILADFLIGAHALENDFQLLTLDDRIYRTAFPRLTLAPL